jgi:hypothetical protein
MMQSSERIAKYFVGRVFASRRNDRVVDDAAP